VIKQNFNVEETNKQLEKIYDYVKTLLLLKQFGNSTRSGTNFKNISNVDTNFQTMHMATKCED
jgi:hypothetical protein